MLYINKLKTKTGNCLAAIILLSCIHSCYKDKSNFDYKSTNEIAIMAPDSVDVKEYEVLAITPVLQQASVTDESRLQYEWSVNLPGIGTDSVVRVLSTARNLNTAINLPSQIDYYLLNYKVKDTVTGITYRKPIKLLVTTDFQSGWMLLEQNGGQADISFINTLKETAFHHAYSAANPGTPLPASAHHVYVFNIPQYNIPGTGQTTQPKSKYNAVLYQDGGSILGNGTMKADGSYANIFYSQPAVIKPEYINMDRAPDMITINNGILYRRFLSSGQPWFKQQYSAPDALGYYLAPFDGNDKSAYGNSLYFDMANHRFLKETLLSSQLQTLSPTAAFDVNNIQGTVVAMASGVYDATNYAVIKNAGTCYLYGISFSIWSDDSFVDAMTSSPGIADATAYIFSSSSFIMYYATGNEIYRYNISDKTTTLMYSFPAGENITAMQLVRNPDFSQFISAATYNNATGSVYTFKLDGTGEIDGGTFIKNYTGFDKIISMAYKE